MNSESDDSGNLNEINSNDNNSFSSSNNSFKEENNEDKNSIQMRKKDTSDEIDRDNKDDNNQSYSKEFTVHDEPIEEIKDNNIINFCLSPSIEGTINKIDTKFLSLNSSSSIDNKQINNDYLNQKLEKLILLMQGCNINEEIYNNFWFLKEISTLLEEGKINKLNKLYDSLFEIMKRIKQDGNIKDSLINKLNNNTISKDVYEKKIEKYQNNINKKNKELETLTQKYNKLNNFIEEKNKSKTLEIELLKKENLQLSTNNGEFKNQLFKYKADYSVLLEKYNKIINYKNQEGDFKNILATLDQNETKGIYVPKEDEIVNIKLFNENLINLLKNINNIIIKYELLLTKKTENII